MHLYALDEKDQVIVVHEAQKQKNYYCLECQSAVRRRGGFLKQVHFYHLEPNRICRQSGKSLTHLQIQYYLQSMLPGSVLEKKFSSINRIADVVDEKERLIFEIQCSPISAREVEERNRSYQSIGYQVVWILHDQLFNKSRLTAAEYFLQESPHYFTDMNEEGKGRIYDQWDIIDKGHRLLSLGLKEVFVSSKYRCSRNIFPKRPYPLWFKKRMHSWPLYFSGDYLHYFLTANSQEIAQFLEHSMKQEKELLMEDEIKTGWMSKLKGMIKRVTNAPYRLTMNMLLEKLTR